MKTYYEILEVSENASDEIIKRAYKVLAKKYHPDLQETPEEVKQANLNLVKINEAYEVLSDKDKKEKYDQKLRKEKEKEKEKQNRRIEVNKYRTEKEEGLASEGASGVGSLKNEELLVEEIQKREEIRKQAEKIQEEIERKRMEYLNRLQDDYYNKLRAMGYNVVYERPLKEKVKSYIIGIITIIILIGIYNIPFIRESIYNIFKDEPLTSGLFKFVDRILTLQIFFGK